MSTLLLVRHAQASFFSENYDQLSPVGQRQASVLGEHLARRKVRFDAVYTGPASRHRETAALVGEEYRRAGLPWPDGQILDGLEEHRADTLLRKESERLLEQHPHLLELVEGYRGAKEPADVQKNFQKLFETVTLMWTRNEVQSDGLDAWDVFNKNVIDAVRTMMSTSDRGGRIIGFSSVGPISVALQMALSSDVHTALHLGWRLRNCSLTQFIFNRERVTLDLFNSVAHLEEQNLVTYR